MTGAPDGRGRRRLGLGAAALLAWALLAVPAGAHDPSPSPPPTAGNDFPVAFGGPFTLIDQDGRTRTDQDFRGRFLLVYFGYTSCPDICPTGLQTVSAALDLLGDDGGRVQPVFISVDPARDRPGVLKEYVSHFHPRLIGLGGSEQQVRRAARAYRIHRGKVVVPGEPKQDYLVSHTPTAFLMGPDGQFVTLFPHGTEAAFMAGALRRYLTRAGS